MAPQRRRVSRRIVKSTFQECFEYEFPAPRKSFVKGPLNLPSQVTKKKETPTENKKLVFRSEPVLKAKARLTKGRAKLAITKAAETLNKKGKGVILPSRLRVRTPLSSALATETKQAKKIKKEITSNTDKKPIRDPDTRNLTRRAVKGNSAFNSEAWQPVVNLEKLSVDGTASSVSSGNRKPPRKRVQSKIISTKKRKKISTSDESLMLTSDTESEKESSSNISLDDEFKGIDYSYTSSSSGGVAGTDTGFEELTKSKGSVIESPNSKGSLNNHSNDSLLEDWPEDVSDSLCVPVGQFPSDNLLNSAHLPKNSSENDWSSPHVTQLMHLQEHFQFITNDLRSSFENLKTIIEDKNTVIESFKTKLQTYIESEYHQLLEKVLQKYDASDPDKPAAKIIKTLRKFADSDK